MKTWANHRLARKWLEEVLGVYVGICTGDEPGMIQFAIHSRFMAMAAVRLKERYHDTYVFERTAHYIADTVAPGPNQRVRLQLGYGSQRVKVTMYDDTDDGKKDPLHD